MQHRNLGATGLTVSAIGFGAASWWGKPAFDEAQAISLVHAALDGGVTLIDTGPAYSDGNAEPRLGRALKGRGAHDLVVSTKAGTFHDGRRVRRDFRLPAIQASVEASLRNLGLDVLPLLQLHGPASAELTDDFLGALSDFKRRGLIRALGVTSFDPAVIEHVVSRAEVDVVMIDYNVLRPERTALIARAAAAGKGVLAGMPLAMGHLQRQVLKLRSRRDVWYALRALRHHRADVLAGAKFGFLADTPGMSAAQAALAYVLDDVNVSAAVVGATRMAHLQDNLAAADMTLPAPTLAAIRRVQGVTP